MNVGRSLYQRVALLVLVLGRKRWLVVLSVLAYMKMRQGQERVVLEYHPGGDSEARVRRCPSLRAYSPTLWFADSVGFAHTVGAYLFRTLGAPRVVFRRELLTLPDGGTVALGMYDNIEKQTYLITHIFLTE
jgi:hypothetical protein